MKNFDRNKFISFVIKSCNKIIRTFFSNFLNKVENINCLKKPYNLKFIFDKKAETIIYRFKNNKNGYCRIELKKKVHVLFKKLKFSSLEMNLFWLTKWSEPARVSSNCCFFVFYAKRPAWQLIPKRVRLRSQPILRVWLKPDWTIEQLVLSHPSCFRSVQWPFGLIWC